MKNTLLLGSSRRQNPIWLIIFSDLSTNLMLFFLVAFAMTRMNATDREMMIEGMEKAMVNRTAIEKRQARKQQEAKAIQIIQDNLEYGRLKQYAKVDITDDKVKMTLEMPFFFPSGSAELASDAIVALEGLVPAFKAFPSDIIIEGHTDNVPVTGGGYQSNWELSVARAVSVIEFMAWRGVDTSKLVAGGYGEFHPVYPNDTAGHRALNRRIEITMLRQPRG